MSGQNWLEILSGSFVFKLQTIVLAKESMKKCQKSEIKSLICRQCRWLIISQSLYISDTALQNIFENYADIYFVTF